MGIWGGAIIGLLSFVITFILLLMFSIAYRKKEMDGYMSFGQAFIFAFMAIIFSTIIVTIYNYIFHTFIAPEYMENLMAVMQQKTIAYMERIGAPEAQIDKTIAKFEEPITIWKTLKQGILGGLIGGLIVSLIVAAIAKKKPADEVPE